MTPFFRFALFVLGPILRLLIRMKVEGKAHLAKERNCIIVSNHISAWDPFVVIVSGWWRVRPLAKKELTDMPVIGLLLRWLGCIRVDRTDGIRAYAEAFRRLAAGEDMLIFPEGTRSKTGQLLDFKPGAVALAVKTRTPLLPVQIIAPKGRGPFGRTVLRYGAPIPPEAVDFGREDAHNHYAKGNSVLRDACLKLRQGDMP